MPELPQGPMDPWFRAFLVVCRESGYVFLRGIERLLGVPGSRRGGD